MARGAKFYMGGCDSVAVALRATGPDAKTVQALLKEHWPQGKLQVRGRCKLCGCTEDRGCDVGCAWVAPDLCTTCAEVFIAVVRWQDRALKPSLMRLHQAANRNPAAPH